LSIDHNTVAGFVIGAAIGVTIGWPWFLPIVVIAAVLCVVSGKLETA